MTDFIQTYLGREEYDLKHWLFYNVIIGLSPVLLSSFLLTFGKVFSQFLNRFLDGTLVDLHSHIERSINELLCDRNQT